MYFNNGKKISLIKFELIRGDLACKKAANLKTQKEQLEDHRLNHATKEMKKLRSSVISILQECKEFQRYLSSLERLSETVHLLL